MFSSHRSRNLVKSGSPTSFSLFVLVRGAGWKVFHTLPALPKKKKPTTTRGTFLFPLPITRQLSKMKNGAIVFPTMHPLFSVLPVSFFCIKPYFISLPRMLEAWGDSSHMVIYLSIGHNGKLDETETLSPVSDVSFLRLQLVVAGTNLAGSHSLLLMSQPCQEESLWRISLAVRCNRSSSFCGSQSISKQCA